ncbi:MAG: FAD:protein FMN transferase [Hyphomicrobiales bacterium]|nr:MAG: FAD:protein FMN transferase [Hyphomicrobiales bacterium]
MSHARITRRRFLNVLAGSAVMSLRPERPEKTVHEWTGTALGADARIVLAGEATCTAPDAIEACLAEIGRLEEIFSLHSVDSELTRLNRQGIVDGASLDLRYVLHVCRTLHEWTDGLFDPTVQPLWELYASWFARGGNREAPPAELVEDVRLRVGFRDVRIKGATVSLSPGCQLTLNGIAQGYITDCVARLLRGRGWTNVLADVGEVAAVGPPPSMRPFVVEVRENGQRLACANVALATSAASALLFSEAHALGHIIDPRSGRASSQWQCVTVRHTSATIADGLSTACALATEDELRVIWTKATPATIWATRPGGSIVHLET